MKKLLSLFCAIVVASSSSTTVVSCLNRHVTQITLISDMGKINDHSFNQSGYEGGNAFYKDALNQSNVNISAIQPKDSTELRVAYSKAISKGATDLILPGFTHQGNIDAVERILESLPIDENGSAVFLDGSTQGNEHVIGLKYKCDVSGFLSGLAAAIVFAINHKDSKEPIVCKMATYGGIANKVAVTCYMSGFLAAIDAFNILKANGDLEALGVSKNNPVSTSRIEIQSEDISKDDDKKFFTNSFGVGDGKIISQQFLANGANIILPVAGPQTGDTLGIFKDENKSPEDTMIVGVDTDQVNGYPEYEEYFATSALKALKASTEIALAHTPDFKDKVSQKALESIEQKPENNVNPDDLKFVDATKNGGGKEITDAQKKLELENAGSSWNGYEVWFNGDIAHGGKNKFTDEQYKILSDLFYGENSKYSINNASDKYFADCVKDNVTNAQLVNESRINQWLIDAKIK